MGLHWTFFILSGQISEKHHLYSEYHDNELCATESSPYSSHRVEKRSYLPPVQCTRGHELTAYNSKVHCHPRLRVVRLPFPNDTSVNQVSALSTLFTQSNRETLSFCRKNQKRKLKIPKSAQFIITSQLFSFGFPQKSSLLN